MTEFTDILTLRGAEEYEGHLLVEAIRRRDEAQFNRILNEYLDVAWGAFTLDLESDDLEWAMRTARKRV